MTQHSHGWKAGSGVRRRLPTRRDPGLLNVQETVGEARTGHLQVGELEGLLDIEAGPDSLLARGLARPAERGVREPLSIHFEADSYPVLCDAILEVYSK